MVSRLIAGGLLSLLLLSCAQDDKPLTQLVLVADTDVPTVDAVQFLVAADDGSHSDMSLVMRTGNAPATVSVVQETYTLGPLTITAHGFKAEQAAPVVTRVHRVSFVKDQTRVVPLHLVATCVAKACPAGQTCSEKGCTAIDLPAEALEVWNGEAPGLSQTSGDGGSGKDGGLDAGTRDAGSGDAQSSDARVPDAGVPTDAAADSGPPPDSGLTACSDGWFDVKTDPYHCGGCDPCKDGPFANTLKKCASGSCNSCIALLCSASDLVCKRGFADCVPDSPLRPNDGCETDVNTSTTHCGGCNKPCANGQTCVTGVCQ